MTELGVSELAVSLLRTFAVKLPGLASSLMEFVSLFAVGLVSVINTVSVAMAD